MAQIRIYVYEDKNEEKLTCCVRVIGRKMTSTWMRKHYGKNWKEEYNAMWYVKEKNCWVIDQKGIFENHFLSVAEAGELFLPMGYTVIKVY